MSAPLLLTIFSDASLKDMKMGIGWWYKSEERSGSGSYSEANFRGTNHLAELYGILAATQAALAAHTRKDLVLIIQCDSAAALGALLLGGCKMAKTSPLQLSPRRNLQTEEVFYLNAFKDLVGDMPVWLKHVKGHSGKGCKRSAINTLTDKLSRKARNNTKK